MKNKIISFIMFIAIMWFLAITAIVLYSMPAQAQASYQAVEAMTPQAIERKRVEGILKW